MIKGAGIDARIKYRGWHPQGQLIELVPPSRRTSISAFRSSLLFQNPCQYVYFSSDPLHPTQAPVFRQRRCAAGVRQNGGKEDYRDCQVGIEI